MNKCLTKNNFYNIACGLVVLCTLLIPLFSINKGIDTMDSSNLLASYKYTFDDISQISFSTSFTKITGALLYQIIPGGHALLFSFFSYCMLLGMGVLVYNSIKDYFPKLIILIGIMIGVFMNKFVNTLGYNHWSMFWFILSIFFMIRAFKRDSTWSLAGAGGLIAFNMFFRFPNILQIGMVIAVFWYYANTQGIKKAVKQSLIYLGGAVIVGILCLLIYISIAGLDGIKESFFSLSALNSNNVYGYGTSSMLSSLFDGLKQGLQLLLHYVLRIFVIWIPILFLNQWASLKFSFKRAGQMIAVVFSMLYALKATGNIEYLDFLRMYAACTVITCGTGALIYRKKNPVLSTACAIAVGVVLVVTLGSNNGSYFFMMGMMYSFSVCLGMLFLFASTLNQRRLYFTLGDGNKLNLRISLQFFYIFLIFVIILGGYVSIVRQTTYTFQDESTNVQTTGVASPVYAGMKTTRQRAEYINEYLLLMKPLDGQPAIIYGNFPIGHVLYDMPASLGTFWPDLPSFSYSEMVQRLEEQESQRSFPVIVFTKNNIAHGANVENAKKINELYSFIDHNNYELYRRTQNFTVYCPEDENK